MKREGRKGGERVVNGLPAWFHVTSVALVRMLEFPRVSTRGIPPTSSSSSVTENVVAFLGKIPPFQFLPASEIRKLARPMPLEYFTKDTVILSAGHRAAEALYIVQKGAVKLALRTQVGKELGARYAKRRRGLRGALPDEP